MRKRENDCFSGKQLQDIVAELCGSDEIPRKGGGQPSNRNAFKTGRYTKQTKQRRAVLREFRNRATLLTAMVESEIARAHQ